MKPSSSWSLRAAKNKMPKLNRFQFWALITTAATYGLIGVGGLVRAAGAGLGCPDWPKCFGSWIPPTSVDALPAAFEPSQFNVWKTWLEYTNRMIGVLIGFLIMATLVLAIRHYRKSPRVLWPTVAAFVLVLFEGWLGGQVVLTELQPLILSLHLAFALVIVSLLLYATVCAFFDGGRPLENLPKWRKRLGHGAFLVGALTLLEVALGALVRGQVQIASKIIPAIPKNEWLDHAGFIFGAHRAYAALLVLALVGLVYLAFQHAEELWLRRTLWVTAALTLLQPLSGLLMSRFGLPAALQVFHLWSGSLLLGVLTVIGLLAVRLPSRA
jgi:cytochrome c oxidase assembly protein subunit 15